jgi:hypothetical protein
VPYPEYYDSNSFNPYDISSNEEGDIVQKLLKDWTPAGEQVKEVEKDKKSGREENSSAGTPEKNNNDGSEGGNLFGNPAGSSTMNPSMLDDSDSDGGIPLYSGYWGPLYPDNMGATQALFQPQPPHLVWNHPPFGREMYGSSPGFHYPEAPLDGVPPNQYVYPIHNRYKENELHSPAEQRKQSREREIWNRINNRASHAAPMNNDGHEMNYHGHYDGVSRDYAQRSSREPIPGLGRGWTIDDDNASVASWERVHPSAYTVYPHPQSSRTHPPETSFSNYGVSGYLRRTPPPVPRWAPPSNEVGFNHERSRYPYYGNGPY